MFLLGKYTRLEMSQQVLWKKVEHLLAASHFYACLVTAILVSISLDSAEVYTVSHIYAFISKDLCLRNNFKDDKSIFF